MSAEGPRFERHGHRSTSMASPMGRVGEAVAGRETGRACHGRGAVGEMRTGAEADAITATSGPHSALHGEQISIRSSAEICVCEVISSKSSASTCPPDSARRFFGYPLVFWVILYLFLGQPIT